MRKPLILGFSALILLLAGTGYFTWKQSDEYTEDQRWISHTNEVLVQIYQTFMRVRDCESANRGFILTGNEAFLASFNEQSPKIAADGERLLELTRDNPVEQERASRLIAALSVRVKKFDELIRIRRESGVAPAAELVTVNRPFSVAIRKILDEMEAEERRLLAKRLEDSEESGLHMKLLFGLMTVSAGLILTALFVVVLRFLDERRRREAVLQDLYDKAPCGYHTVDAAGTLVRMNRTELGWLGYTREELEGRMSLRDILPPAPVEEFNRGWAAFKASGSSLVGYEARFRRRNGTDLPVLVNAELERDPQGRFLQARVSVFDITDRKRAEQDLDQFFATSLDLMGIADLATGRFTRVSPSWATTLGWSAEEVTSRPWTDFVHPEDLESTNAAAGQLAMGAPVAAFENRYRCKDGSYRWMSWKVPAPLPGATTLYPIARDVTETKRTEQSLRDLNAERARRIQETVAANKELEAFSYSVSHDLRAPLRAIDGFSRMLIEDHGEKLDAEARRLLNVVRTNTQRMGQLIDDLLEFSRLGRRELDRGTVDMMALAQEAVDEARKGESGREVDLRIAPLPAVKGDRALLRQVWVNLVSNAFKYSRKAGRAAVEISTERRNGEAVFSVRDNGVGFDMAYVDKLFGVFQRLHAKTEFEGTGVGLAIVQRVVQRHNGRVWAEGKPGGGAVFSFSIPD